MLYRIAISPEVFIDAASRKDGIKILSPIWNLFQETCLLVDFNDGQWVNFIKSLSFPPAFRDKLLIHLSKLKDKNRIINQVLNTETPRSNDEWNAVISNTYIDGYIDFIVCNENSAISNLISNEDEVVIEFPVEFSHPVIKKINESKNWMVTKNEIEVNQIIKNLFSYAKVATIVDPYLNCKHLYYQKPIISLAKTLNVSNSNSSEKYINIYASKKKSGYTKSQFELFWAPFLKAVARDYKVTITLNLLGSSKSQQHLHDRFIFSEKCGISIPSDFSIDQEGKEGTGTWQLLTEEKYSKNIQEFLLNSVYQVLIKKQYYPNNLT